MRNTYLEDKKAFQIIEEKKYRQLKVDLLDAVSLYIHHERHDEYLFYSLCARIMHILMTSMPSRQLSADELDSIHRKNERLIRFKRFVDNNYRYKIRLQDFAEEEGCSVGYLSGFIARELGMSFREYVNLNNS